MTLKLDIQFAHVPGLRSDNSEWVVLLGVLILQHWLATALVCVPVIHRWERVFNIRVVPIPGPRHVEARRFYDAWKFWARFRCCPPCPYTKSCSISDLWINALWSPCSASGLLGWGTINRSDPRFTRADSSCAFRRWTLLSQLRIRRFNVQTPWRYRAVFTTTTMYCRHRTKTQRTEENVRQRHSWPIYFHDCAGVGIPCHFCRPCRRDMRRKYYRRHPYGFRVPGR